MSDDKRRVRFEGEDYGLCTLRELVRMRDDGDLGDSAEFWSERHECWKPIVMMLTDFEVYPEERIKSMRDAGFKRVALLLSAQGACATCRKLAKEVYPIESAPELPPPGCTCIPWCGTIYIVREGYDEL